MRPRRRSAVVAALLATGIAILPLGAQAETFYVDTTFDLADDTPGDGLCSALIVVSIDPLLVEFHCSLRAAIQEANALLGPDTILLPPGQYSLSRNGSGEDAGATGDLDVWDDLEITGGWPCSGPGPCVILDDDDSPHPEDTVVGWTDAVPVAERDRVFDTHAIARVELYNLTVRGGRAAIGAGIRTGLGELRLLRCIVRKNVADDPGGAATTIAGAGIELDGGTLEILLSEINDNEARDPLGAAGTSEGGGIRNRGGMLSLVSSTVARNTAGDRGGAIVSSGEVLSVNSTLSGNAAPRGGALHQTGANALSLWSHVTVTENEAHVGGGLSLAGGTLRLQASILAGNEAPAAPECDRQGSAELVSGGYNLLGAVDFGTPGGCYQPPAIGPPGDLTEAEPQLGPLADHGGDTPVHEPLAGSLAIDRGDEACVAIIGVGPGGAVSTQPLDVDQRSVARPSDGDGDGTARCDAGAVERVPEPGAAAAALTALLSLLGVQRTRAALFPNA